MSRGATSKMLVLAVAVLSVTACRAPEQRRPIDERLLAALGMAQSYQHQAAELAELGERRQAIERVRRVLEIPFPDGVPEAEDVLLDAYGRIAELELEEGNLDQAEAELDHGASRATRASFFKARLINVRGRVLRARAQQLREQGSEEQARQVSREAIEAFERSIEINREVLGMVGEAER